jgi:hypothetical protein
MNFPDQQHQEEIDRLPGNFATKPWLYTVGYKSGKTPQAFAQAAKIEDVNGGFNYYDQNVGDRVKYDYFTAYIADIVYMVTGTVPDGDKYMNFYSNPVKDSRTQNVRVYMQGSREIQYSGTVNFDSETKTWSIGGKALQQGIGLTMFFVCVLHGTGEVFLLEATSKVSSAMKKAIAAPLNQEPKKVRLYTLCDMTSQVYAVKFEDAFVKVDKEGQPYTGKGDMFFEPVLKIGKYTQKPESQAFFDMIHNVAESVRLYVDSLQHSKPDTAPAPSAVGDSTRQEPAGMTPPDAPLFPESAPVATQSNGDDLPF